MRRTYLTLLTLLLLTGSKSFAVTLHAVIAGDTHDPAISQQVQASLVEVNAFVNRVKANTGLELNLKLLSGEQLDFSSFKTILSDLTVKTEDVVIFYYAGHGFNQAQGSSWPTLTLKGQSLDSTWIREQLQGKKPRLLIALTDVGNSFVVPSNSKGVKDTINSDDYRQLFLQSQGYLVATSAYPEQLAGGDAKGGYFTNAFLELVSSKSDWEEIVSATKQLQFEMKAENGRSYRQQPIVEQSIITKGVVDNVVADQLVAVSYTYLSGGQQATLTQDSVLHSSDTFKIHLTPSDQCKPGCYVYIYQKDSNGQLRDLFPWPGKVTVKNPLQTAVVLPSEDHSYQLDNRTGEEMIFVFASKQPFSETKGTGDVVPDRTEKPCTKTMGCVNSLTFKHE